MNADELKRIGTPMAGKMGARLIPWKRLAEAMRDDEKVLGVFHCKADGKVGGMLITENRVLVEAGGGMMGGVRKVSRTIDRALISSIEVGKLDLLITTSSGECLLNQFPKSSEAAAILRT